MEQPSTPPALLPASEQPPGSPPERKRAWGRVTFPQVLAIVLMAGLVWTAVAVLGLVVIGGGIINAAPGMVNQMVGQFLGDVVDDYMVRMYYRDLEAAAQLFLDYPVSRLTRELDENYVLYDGYLETRVLDVEGLPEDWMDDSEDASLEGAEATVTGEILYEGGYTGTFEARLLNSERSWYLTGISITVPQEKIDAYEQSNP